MTTLVTASTILLRVILRPHITNKGLLSRVTSSRSGVTFLALRACCSTQVWQCPDFGSFMAQQSEGWLTYGDPLFGLTISYPASWNKNNVENGITLYPPSALEYDPNATEEETAAMELTVFYLTTEVDKAGAWLLEFVRVANLAAAKNNTYALSRGSEQETRILRISSRLMAFFCFRIFFGSRTFSLNFFGLISTSENSKRSLAVMTFSLIVLGDKFLPLLPR
jgi:hypothetical protein